jgi:muconolactone delta-isomerase
VRIPPDTDQQKVSSLSAQEHQRAAELQRAGKWMHLWRVAGKYNEKNQLSVPYTAEQTDVNEKLGPVFATDAKTVASAFSGALAATPLKPAIYVIFFLNGQTVLDPRSVDTLSASIVAARTTPFPDISVVGHSDSVGSDYANLVLSMYRAQTIRTALVSGGVSPSVIEVGYHGANDPRVAGPRGVPEPENRRVEVTIR